MGRVIIDELEFNVPYGKLAAKTWHEETDECKRVLFLHGWMDNSGSFDCLAPLIHYDDGLYMVGIDLPGHGRSSQLPVGSAYCDILILMEIRRCLKELKWIQRHDENGETKPQKKFTIIGHSLGAGLGLYYASAFPDDVEEVILLDFLKSKTEPPGGALKNLALSIDQFLATVPSEDNSNHLRQTNRIRDKGQVVVSQEAAIIATIDAHKQLGSLTREEAACLLKRSTVAVSTPPNSVIYSRDLRLHCMLNIREDWELNKILFSGVKCHIIAVLARSGIYAKDMHYIHKMDEMEKLLKAKAKTFYIQWVDGDHFVHMNNAQSVAELISNYLRSPGAYKIV